MEKPRILSPDSASSASGSEAGLDTDKKIPPTPLRCFTGSLMASVFSLLGYRITLAIATSFANKPVISTNPAVVNISAAVRTLVTGMAALGTGIFGMAALGLAALGVQLLVKKIQATDKDL